MYHTNTGNGSNVISMNEINLHDISYSTAEREGGGGGGGGREVLVLIS